MMAVEVCEVLCFLRNNFDKVQASQLKPVLVSFYKDEELMDAKEILLKAVKQVIVDAGGDPNTELPRLPRRQGDNKGKITADDLLKLFTIIDERDLTGVLPRYTADDLTRIPFVNADSISIITMAKRIDAFEQRMNSIEQLLISSTSQSQVQGNIANSAAETSLEDRSNSDLIDGADAQESMAGVGTWHEVSYQRNRRQGIVNTNTNNCHSSVHASSVRAVNSAQNSKQHATRKIFGTRSSNDASLKPGVTIVKKAVVHIDNLDPGCTPALLEDYLLAGGVSVLSCYNARSWMRDDERDRVTAFRVCVPAEQRHKIFDPDLWSEGVIIRDWKFKKTQNGERS